MKEKSKLLSFILRHKPEKFGVVLDTQGWTNVDELLSQLRRHRKFMSRLELLDIVRTNDKQRFQLSPDQSMIRAVQGHSTNVQLDHQQLPPPLLLYHGTIQKFLPAIRKEGLTKQGRHHVHLSATVDEATAVGARRGAPVVLTVYAVQMTNAGHKFFLSPNHVWLIDYVPPEFIWFPGDANA